AWSKLGSTVTIVEATSGLLPAMDPRLGRTVRRRLKDLGVEVLTESLAIRMDAGHLVVASATDRSTERTLECDVVVVAVGRNPNVSDLGVERYGPKVSDSGHIVVDPQRRAAPHIYAIGDVTDGPALAHKATAEAEVAADAVAGLPAAFDPAAIPEVVFCDPEVVSVGYSPGTAKDADIATNTFRFPFIAGSRSRTIGDTAGFVQLVADESGTIIGAQAAGHGVSELSGELALAIEMGATAFDLAETIHAHPTMSEAIAEAALGLDGRPLHVTN
ncbi:MAG: FAD-dependent oxidoreductase, partial [Actinobacteria bacterium]|nr:FAD-dependent oxidoreductase [Actinomycetota bacterium]